MISARTSRKVLRSAACFEAAKGLVVLLAGFGALSLLGRDLRSVAYELVGWLHLNPGHHFTRVFIEAATHMTDSGLRLVALCGFAYSLFRLLEAYGLWFERNWAAWLAVVSGGLFLPLEIYELAVKFTGVRVCALLANLALVLALVMILWRNKRLAGDAGGREPCCVPADAESEPMGSESMELP